MFQHQLTCQLHVPPLKSLCTPAHVDPAALQGHVLTTRHGGSALPCPLVNFTAFDQVLAAAYGLPAGSSLAQIFGTPFSESECLNLLHGRVDSRVVALGEGHYAQVP